ncbi:MAG TPA: putative aminohydrolase SsnA [Anaeromyxobacter sp.]|nr:putative aminohydrolase SsnA [Anaeromyxobacter sp.]
MAPRTLVRGGTLLTLGPACRVLEDHDLLLEGDRIARMGPSGSLPGPFDQTLDARGKVVLPGLINAHMHFYSTLVRGLGKAAPSKDFQEVLAHLWWRLDRKLSLDDVEVSAEVALLEAIRKGTTTLVDHHASPGAVRGSLDRIARAVRRTGLRACLCYEVSDRDGERVTEEGLEENAAFARSVRGGGDAQLRALFGLHAAFTLSDATLERAAALGRELAVGFHVHVAEARSDVEVNRARHGQTPVQRLFARGLLGKDSIAAHAVHVDRGDVELLAQGGAFVAHNPQSNLNNAVGIADVVGLRRAGVPVGLGTDAMTLNMLEEVRVGLWAQHLRQDHPSSGFGELTGALTERNPELASRLWGFPLGTLEPGSAADLAILDYHPPTPLEDATALGHLVFGLSQAVVDTTVCGGRVLMEGKRLHPDLDEERVMARSRELARRLWERF